ncbi:MAG: 3'(2'),5'-bisphosphate nucleotidase CysQ [Deinococcales bacterium]|nr:3'(2'),5'-bisphosphate nucleotidase CysQ [Deinococcales bacterium]
MRLAQEAGEKILEVYATEFEVTRKADTSPVTAADLASQRHIVQGLAELTPFVPVIGEEEAAPPFEERRAWRRFWLVDPLDGTKEFVKRNGEFSVNIALVENGLPILGVVHAPVTGLTYLGSPRSAHGPASAWRFDAEGNAHPIHVAPPSEDAVRVMVSRSHANPATLAFIEALRGRYGAVETIARGSAIKSCLVADGTAHYYPRLGPTMWWDTAAAQAVLIAAGGEMIAEDGSGVLRYGGESLGNPGFVAVFSREAWLPG